MIFLQLLCIILLVGEAGKVFDMIYNDHYVDGDKLVDSLGIRGNRSGDNLSATCPFHQDKNPSFSISLTRGLWLCFSGQCGLSGNLEQLVERILGCSLLEANRYILDFSETHAVSMDEILGDQKKYFPKPIEIMDEDVLIDDMWGPGWFRSRGFDEDDISEWHIMYEPSTDAMVIPVDGGFIKRYPPSAPIRYKYSDGLRKSFILFGYERLLEKKDINQLLLVEGSLDCIWGTKYNYDTVAILGSSLSNKQMKKLAYLNPKEIVLCLDNDKAGWKAAQNISDMLKEKFHLSYLKIPDNHKDIQELNEEELHKAFNDRTDVLIMKLFNMPPFEAKKKEKKNA